MVRLRASLSWLRSSCTATAGRRCWTVAIFETSASASPAMPKTSCCCMVCEAATNAKWTPHAGWLPQKACCCEARIERTGFGRSVHSDRSLAMGLVAAKMRQEPGQQRTRRWLVLIFVSRSFGPYLQNSLVGAGTLSARSFKRACAMASLSRTTNLPARSLRASRPAVPGRRDEPV